MFAKLKFVPRKCHLIKQGETDESHVTLRRAGQIKQIPGALLWQFVCGARIWQTEPKSKQTHIGVEEKPRQVPATVLQQQTILETQGEKWRENTFFVSEIRIMKIRPPFHAGMAVKLQPVLITKHTLPAQVLSPALPTSSPAVKSAITPPACGQRL